MADNFTPTPYVNPMAKQLNGPIIQALLKAKHAMFSSDGDELIAHRNHFSVDIATTQELEWLGLFCNVPRPYAVIDGEIVQATDDEYKLFFKNVMALRQSQSLLGLAEVFYQFLPNGEFQLQIKETTGDIRVILDERYERYLPFLQQAASSVFTASPQLQPFESRDYYSYIFDNGLYLRYIQLAQPNFWEFEYNDIRHAFIANSQDLEALTLGFDEGQLTADADQEGYFIPRDGCISPEVAFVIKDGAIKLKDGYITYNANGSQNTNGKGVFVRNPFNVMASPAITYDVMYAPRDKTKPLPIESDYMAFLAAYDANLHALIMNNIKTVSPSYIASLNTITQGIGVNTSYTMKYLVYANSLWVCGSNSHGMWWSEDGKSWTQGTGSNTTYSMQYSVYANGLWVCGSVSHGLWWSEDGKSWTQGVGANTTYTMAYLAYANGLWVCGSNSHGMWWSEDGKNWTQGTGDNTTHTMQYLAHANSLWVCGSSRQGMWWSEDGKNWTQGTGDNTTHTAQCLEYGNGLWVCGYENRGACWSEDGKSWTQCTTLPYSAMIRRLYWANNLWVCGVDASLGIWWSEDGKDWTKAETTVQLPSSSTLFVSALGFANGIWWAGLTVSGAFCLWSEDGKHWDTYPEITITIREVAYYDNVWIAFPYFANLSTEHVAYYYSLNGKDWTEGPKIKASVNPRDSIVAYNKGLWAIGTSKGVWYCGTDLGNLDTTGYYKDKIANYGKQSLDKVERSVLAYDPLTHSANVKIFDVRRIAVMNVTREE